MVGLTEIEIFDISGQKIRLAPSCLTLEGRLSDDPSQLVQITRVQLGRLIKGSCKVFFFNLFINYFRLQMIAKCG